MISTNIQQISLAYSYLGHVCIFEGNVDAVKFLYGNIYNEHPPLIKTISLVMDCLTAKEIYEDTQNKYCCEFLYYFGMACMGEASRLSEKNLDTALLCFKKIIKVVPKVNARIAFIELLLSTDFHKSSENVRRVDLLREWAGKQDIFSMIALSKIVYEHFLKEKQVDDFSKLPSEELPIKAIRLLETPCRKGHPVAINFYNALIDNIADVGIQDIFGMKIDTSRINVDILYDY